jgi:hypothetical protein
MERTSTVADHTIISPQRRLASTLNLLLGAWLFIAGFVLAGTQQAMGNDLVLGALIFIFAAARMSRNSAKAWSWLNFLLGIWLLFAPWALHYTSASARWNDFSVGCAVIILSLISASAREQVMQRGLTEMHAPEHRRAA